MKKFLLVFLSAGVLLFAACTNTDSSTVATQDDGQTTTHATKAERDQTETKQMKEGSVTTNQDTVRTNEH